MAKTKKQKEEAKKHLAVLDPETRAEVLKQEGFTDAETKEILDELAAQDAAANTVPVEEAIEEAEVVEEVQHSAIPEPPTAPAPVVAEKPKPAHKGHPRYEEVQLYRTPERQLKEGEVLKTVSIEADRAERLNAQSANTMIRYRPVK